MSDYFYPPSIPETGESQTPKRRPPSRTLAILLMLAGVVAFVCSRLVFGDQVLFLLVSTLITFAGLYLWIAARRSSADQGKAEKPATGSPPPPPSRFAPVVGRGATTYRQVPRGLRAAARRQAAAQPPMAQPVPPEPPGSASVPTAGRPPGSQVPMEKIPVFPGLLVEQVIALLEGQGTQVDAESLREGRGLLKVQTADGQKITILVRDGQEPVDVSDVRALAAMVANSASAGGYLIASAPFTQQAYDWAGARKIHLVREDELDEFSV